MFEEYLDSLGRLKRNQPQEVRTQYFIHKAKLLHGDKYDYSLVVYTKSQVKVPIICPIHGEFLQTPGNHTHSIKRPGCPTCGNSKVSQKLTKELSTVLDEFRTYHGDNYDYSNVHYTAMLEKVEIICKTPGSFFMRPSDHRQGSGCPKCQGHNQNILYLLKCGDTGLIKIGITNNIKRRISEIKGNLSIVELFKLADPRSMEKHLHSLYKQLNVYNPYVKQSNYEFFQLNESHIAEIRRILE